jgi:iron uptake system component EfeO
MHIHRLLATAVGILLLTLSACGGNGESSAQSYGIKAGDTTCEVEDTSIPAGEVSFDVENTGSDVTEVYVYGKEGDEFSKIMGEVENIGPGTSQDFIVDLTAGDYEVACKRGMVGDGIRTQLTVTSAG